MERYYLAIDIGASSGRHMLGHIEDGKMILEEIWRFENGMKEREGSLCWDLDALFEEIKTGMKRCKELGKIPVSMGIVKLQAFYLYFLNYSSSFLLFCPLAERS